jgi:hypothetical protein
MVKRERLPGHNLASTISRCWFKPATSAARLYKVKAALCRIPYGDWGNKLTHK